jgi:hypothetical protein
MRAEGDCRKPETGRRLGGDGEANLKPEKMESGGGLSFVVLVLFLAIVLSSADSASRTRTMPGGWGIAVVMSRHTPALRATPLDRGDSLRAEGGDLRPEESSGGTASPRVRVAEVLIS